MLHADKANLESSFRLRMLHIREKELMYFVRNCQNLANLAALISGMAQSGLIFTKYIDFNLCGQGLISWHDKELLCAEFTYPLFISLTMGLSLLSMWVAMLVSMLAPGYALRGPYGSMDACVRMIGEEYQSALFVLACSVAMFLVSAILWAWSNNQLIITIILTLIVLFCAWLIYLTTAHTVAVFDIKHGEIVTGKMTDVERRRRASHDAAAGAWRGQRGGYAPLREEAEGGAEGAASSSSPPRGDSPSPPEQAAWWGYRMVEKVCRRSPAPLRPWPPRRTSMRPRARPPRLVLPDHGRALAPPLALPPPHPRPRAR